MADHFTLDVDPHQLRTTAHSLDTIRESLTKHAKTATTTPGNIGTKWTGYTATSVTSEMTAVGGHLSTFATYLEHCSTALTTLAGHYERAQQTVADLNTKWAKAESTYQSACKDADDTYNKAVGDLKKANGGTMPNRGLTMDLDDSRSSAKSTAYQAQQKAQSALTTDFTTLKQHLTTQTTACGTALSANIPVKNLGMCTADNPTGLDHSNLLTDLTLVSDYEELEQEAEDDQAAVDDAAPEIKALQDALKDGDDPDAIAAALKAIQDHVNGPYGSDYSKAMLDALGSDPAAVAKAVNGIYNNLDWAVRRNAVDPHDQKDAILALTDGLATGLSQYSDADYGKFYGELAGMDQGAAQLALIASSGHADARQTSGALALQSRWYHYPSGSRDLFPEIFQYAYDPPEDMVKLLSERSSADALATDLENVEDPKKLDYLFQSLTLLSRGDRDMTDSEANIEYNLLTQTIDVLKQRFITSSDHDQRPSTALVHALQNTSFWGTQDVMQRQDLDDKMLGELTSVLNDPDFVRSYLDQTRASGDYPKTLIAHLIDTTHFDTSTMVKQLIASEVKADEQPDQIARLIGDLMRDQDLGTMELDWSKAGMAGVQEAIGDALSKLAETNPVTGAVYGPLKAILDDLGDQQGKIDDAYKTWDDSQKKDVVQNEVAVALYIKEHGVPKSFTDWMSQPDMKGQPDAVSRYFQDIMRHGSDVPGEKGIDDELGRYADLINGSRDNN
jgi:hypothetical protein